MLNHSFLSPLYFLLAFFKLTPPPYIFLLTPSSFPRSLSLTSYLSPSVPLLFSLLSDVQPFLPIPFILALPSDPLSTSPPSIFLLYLSFHIFPPYNVPSSSSLCSILTSSLFFPLPIPSISPKPKWLSYIMPPNLISWVISSEQASGERTSMPILGEKILKFSFTHKWKNYNTSKKRN